MVKVLQLAGRYAGEEIELPYHVAKAKCEGGTAIDPRGLLGPALDTPSAQAALELGKPGSQAAPAPRPRGRPRIHRPTDVA